MDNDNHYFFRVITEPNILKRDCQREYPHEVFPFGSDGVELFAHEFEGVWRVTEKSTGLLVTRGNDHFTAFQNAQKFIDEMGREKFISNIKDIFSKLNEGLEYDYQSKQWVDPVDKKAPKEQDCLQACPTTSGMLIQEVGDGADD